MNYIELLEIILSDDVFNKFKQNEQEIFELIPELKVCKGFEQNNKWHIYDVYEHILHVVSLVENNKILRLSALFHDIGKPLTFTLDQDGIGHFYNHWNKSIEIFKKYQYNFDLSKEEIYLISNLIFYHDVNIEKMEINDLKNMMNLIGKDNVKLLFSLKRADLLSQSPDFHYLIKNINNQEKNIINNKILIKEYDE